MVQQVVREVATQMIGSTQYTGIIKTVPHKFVFEEYGATRFMDDFFYRLNADWRNCFLFTMPSIPKIGVLHFYLLIDGRVRFRANIVEYRGPKTLHFSRGRTISGKVWVLLCGPVVRAPFKVEMKGFRGFRYTEDLW
jgi:hypothetical protein